MSKRRSTPHHPWLRRLRAVLSAASARLLVTWRALRSGRPPACVEVLATDRIERRLLEREIRAGLRRLERVSSPTLSCQTCVLVQRMVQSNHPLAGCALVSQTSEGRRFTLIRLATHVGERALALDEILSVLAELWIGVAAEQVTTPVVLVPVELDKARTASRPLDALPSDPLVTRTNGHVSLSPDLAA